VTLWFNRLLESTGVIASVVAAPQFTAGSLPRSLSRPLPTESAAATATCRWH
jgi:hypothetical protein